MYTKALGRPADSSGVAYWTKSLEEGRNTGASIGADFLLGAEMQSLNLSDDEYLDRLYRTFMNREADAEGKEYWKGFLEKGCSRKYVLAGLINSKEFSDLCASYGILQGQYQSPESRDINPAATAFVNRLYRLCLGRSGDVEGLNYWTLQLLNGKASGSTVAYQFIFGKEFTSKNLSDGAYLDYLYEAFMGRRPDVEGKKHWQGLLDKGCSRKFVFANFSSSKEFSSICTSYGILRGSYQSPEARDQNPQVTAFVKQMYETCLGRNADADELNYWAGRLNSGNVTGTETVYDFFARKEFTSKEFSNSAYIDKLYEAVLGRSADASGKQYWLRALSSMRKTRRTLLSAFMDSKEFSELCLSYGIQRGDIEKPGREEDFINAALDQLGKPYKPGGKGPDEFDCSGFIYYALRQSGNDIPYMTPGGWAESSYPTIALEDLQRGDIICMPGHVAIYLGEGVIVDASTSNNAIVVQHWEGIDSGSGAICGKRPL